jgi:hypothetical protein
MALVGVLPVPAKARQDVAPQGVDVLTQGPIHEAFAEPVIYDPKPGPVVPKEPPPPVNELPPDQKPEGANVQWIPGYWAWDDARKDYIWVSGLWRAMPPGRQWVPGYWQGVEGGYRWVPGYWAGLDANRVQYLPEPPASLENGPNAPPPSANATWAPGNWVWQGDGYAWRPGFWVEPQGNWMWTPASFAYTPNGYLYNAGYWDYPLASRGQPFAPVAFSQPLYAQPNFLYTPSVGLLTSALLSSLFVRPAYGSYYFGNYYAANNFQNGIYPWYAFHGSRYGYDPIYAYESVRNLRTNPRWADELHRTYNERRDNPQLRPAGTFAEMQRRGGAAPVLARPLNQLTGAQGVANTGRFEHVEAAQRQELARQAARTHGFAAERQRREVAAHRDAPAAALAAPRHVDAPRSPIASPHAEASRSAPPAMPQHPQVDRAVRPTAAPSAVRHEPRVETRPPAPHPAPAPARGGGRRR